MKIAGSALLKTEGVSMYNFLTVLDLPGLFFCCIMGEMDAFVRDIFQNDLTKYYGGGVFYSMRMKY